MCYNGIIGKSRGDSMQGIILKCRVCNTIMIADEEEFQNKVNEGQYITCLYDGRHGDDIVQVIGKCTYNPTLSKEKKYQDLEKLQSTGHIYKRKNGRVVQIK